MKSVDTNTLFLFILQIFNYLAPLLLLPFLTRTLPVGEFGAVMVAMSALQLAFVITDYGFGLSATYHIAKNRDDKAFIDDLIARIFTSKLILVCIAVVLLLVVALLPAYAHHTFIFVCGVLAVVAQAYQPLWLFQGLERMKNYTIYMVLTKIIHVCLVLLLVRNHGDGYIVLLSWSCSNLVGMAAALIMVRRLGYALGFSNITDALTELKNSAQFFWSRISVALFTSASSIIVGTSGLQQAALFSAAEQAYKAGQNVTSPISQSLYPYMAKEKNWTLFKKVVFPVGIVILIGSSVVSYLGEFFLGLVFGADYLGAKQVLSIFMLTLVVNFFSVNFGYPACAAIDRPDIANKTVMFGAILHASIIVILFAGSKISALNIALSVLITEIFVLIMRILSVRLNLFKNE